MKEALIDTDILSYFLKGEIGVVKKMMAYLKEYPKLNISIVTKYEVLSGLEYKKTVKQIENFDIFLKQCKIINLSDKSVRYFAKIYGELRRKGITIGTSDLLIAGIASANNWQLITNNEKHYKEITGLEISNWKN